MDSQNTRRSLFPKSVIQRHKSRKQLRNQQHSNFVERLRKSEFLKFFSGFIMEANKAPDPEEVINVIDEPMHESDEGPSREPVKKRFRTPEDIIQYWNDQLKTVRISMRKFYLVLRRKLSCYILHFLKYCVCS